MPADPPLRRVGIEVDFPEEGNGNVIDYVVTDKEVAYGLGANSLATRVEGFCTSGGHIDIGSMKSIIKNHAPGILGTAAAYYGGGAVAAGVVGTAVAFYNAPEVLNSIIPEGRASALIRVFGSKGATGDKLAGLALRIGFSKFGANWSRRQGHHRRPARHADSSGRRTSPVSSCGSSSSATTCW